jgi:hypothetical protein
MNRKLIGSNWSPVPWNIARLINDTIIPGREKPSKHIIEKIRTIVIVVLNNGNGRHRLLPGCVADRVCINRIRRANVLRNILYSATAK